VWNYAEISVNLKWIVTAADKPAVLLFYTKPDLLSIIYFLELEFNAAAYQAPSVPKITKYPLPEKNGE
jgi:hypothetical protein